MARATSKAARTTEKGLVIERRFSTAGVHPYDELEAVVRRYKAEEGNLSDPSGSIGLSPQGAPRKRRDHAGHP